MGQSLNIGNGVSDFHNFIFFSTKIQLPRKLQNILIYRSYKHFDACQFKHDLSSTPYHVAKMFYDFDYEYWFINELMVDHYGDVIMGLIASQITSLTIIYSSVYSGADQRKHQSSASLAFVRRIHRRPVTSPHKGPVTRKMFPFDDVIMCH